MEKAGDSARLAPPLTAQREHALGCERWCGGWQVATAPWTALCNGDGHTETN